MFFKKTVVLGLTTLLLTGCGGSSTGGSDQQKPTVGSGNLKLPDAITQVAYQHQPQHPELSGQVSYRALELPAWASLNKATGKISGKPSPEDASAQVPITIEATNGTHTLTLSGAIKVEHKAAYLNRPGRDFYSKNYDGNTRALRNDLSEGDLQGEVQFIQTHSMAPANNFEHNASDETQSKYMPRLTALRGALLLFIPENSAPSTTMHVEVSVHGQPLMTLPMAHPNALPASDVNSQETVQYSASAWSVRLPWASVRNGLSLRFIADKESKKRSYGDLPAAAIDIGEASQIVFQTIRLGMLTEPGYRNGHHTLRDPILAATDYFQTMPVSKLVMGSYADTVLDRVILRSGTIYDRAIDGASQVNGDVYSGDMRENVGKSQVSVGINMANFGYTSNHMNQGHPHVFKQITNHHAWGMYQNGRVAHGLSGGNGIGTLYDTWGNEASHEWGHAYGLGHYPGKGLTEDGRWAVHHADSGWGYIAHRNRMRANLFGINDQGFYNYKRDAMSGGSSGGPLSVYTHYTGYSARVIQNDVARFPIPDPTYPAGYKKWNTTTGQYENHTSNHPAPEHVGVPVATILGGYDPDGTAAVIYPVFHGNYGNVFDLPEPEFSSESDICWVDINNAEGEQKRIRLASYRHNAGSVNQLHFNLHADFNPTHASLSCRRNGSIQMLTETSFEGTIPELPPVAIVGQDAGYRQLRAREIAEIEPALMALDTNRFNVLNGALAIKTESYSDQELMAGLSKNAWERLSQLRSNEASAQEIAVIVEKARREGLSLEETRSQLMQVFTENNLIDSVTDLALTGDVIQGNGLYFDTTLINDNYIALTPVSANMDSAPRWAMDLRGRLHPAATPWQCLTPKGDRLGLSLCQTDNANQRWAYNPDNQQLRNEGNGRCLDYAHHNGTLLTYGCSGNWNQKWSGVVVSENRLLALLNGDLLITVSEILLGNTLSE